MATGTIDVDLDTLPEIRPALEELPEMKEMRRRLAGLADRRRKAEARLAEIDAQLARLAAGGNTEAVLAGAPAIGAAALKTEQAALRATLQQVEQAERLGADQVTLLKKRVRPAWVEEVAAWHAGLAQEMAHHIQVLMDLAGRELELQLAIDAAGYTESLAVSPVSATDRLTLDELEAWLGRARAAGRVEDAG